MNEKEDTFQTADGTEIFYRSWLPAGLAENSPLEKAVVIFHRGHEHSGRTAFLARDLKLDGFAIFAWDQRGHGRSSGQRGYAPEFFDLVRDIDAFIRHIRQKHHLAEENIAIIAHSVASVIVLLWLINFGARIRALVLATPAFRVKLYVPFALPALRLYQLLWQKLGEGTPFIRSYVSGKMLTHDTDFAHSYEKDPLVCKRIAVNVLTGLFDGATRILQDAGAVRTPLQLHCARADWVVKNRPAREFFEKISSRRKEVRVYRGFYHAIFHEAERQLPIENTRRFILEAFETVRDDSDLVHGDQEGYTFDEYQWTAAGLPLLSPLRWLFALTRLAMQTVGQLSEGIRLGLRTGFDSGPTLDYVYQNRAQGKTIAGRLIDRIYLDSIGWRGIRERRRNLEEAIVAAIENCIHQGRGDAGAPIRIVDVAGGGSRYLIDSVLRFPDKSFDLLIRDWSEESLAMSRKVADELFGSEDRERRRIRIVRGDAFSDESLAEIGTGIDIAITSGLFELFAGNAGVARCLAGLSAAVRRGGILIYTNQPWHPQLLLIAETLKNRDGKPWIMRRRTQAEIDQLARQAGFEKQQTRVDNFGIFTVSAAVKS